MINIYAQTFMNATRTGEVRLRDAPTAAQHKRHRWFAHRRTRCANPADL